MLQSRIEELKAEFQEQVKLLQAHYEGRVAEVQAMLKKEEESKTDKSGG